MSKPKLLIVGDAIHDVHVACHSRPSPETEGVQVLTPGYSTHMAGGAAAVACMAAALGARVKLAAVLDDKINLECLKQKVDTSFCLPADAIPTKTRYYDDEGLMVTRIDEHDSIRTAVGWMSAGSVVVGAAEAADLILIADYGKGTLSKDVLRAIIATHGSKVIVDPARGRSWTEYRGCLGIKANAAEYAEWEREFATLKAMPADPWQWLITTNGQHGAKLWPYGGGDVEEFPAIVVSPDRIDTIGAGDQFFACLGVMLAEGVGISEACGWANFYAGLGVEKFGTTPVTLEDAAEAIDDPEPADEVPAEQVAQP